MERLTNLLQERHQLQNSTIEKEQKKKKLKVNKDNILSTIGYPSWEKRNHTLMSLLASVIDKQEWLVTDSYNYWLEQDKTVFKQCFPIMKRNNFHDHLFFFTTDGIFEMDFSTFTQYKLKRIIGPIEFEWQEYEIAARRYRRLVAIRTIQKHIRLWLGQIRYSNGKKGLIFRKAENEFLSISSTL